MAELLKSVRAPMVVHRTEAHLVPAEAAILSNDLARGLIVWTLDEKRRTVDADA